MMFAMVYTTRLMAWERLSRPTSRSPWIRLYAWREKTDQTNSEPQQVKSQFSTSALGDPFVEMARVGFTVGASVNAIGPSKIEMNGNIGIARSSKGDRFQGQASNCVRLQI
ncbi:unnamed protein product [Prorocentrum cordatum]|uniref:Uncharacterized protein n=1 Tax=Prorocentrum cordatum TaxID=2364126 RepID=A0ABN9VHP9_9DINO|nr:unnamed protein product [Polarella glacialis]